MRLFVALEPSPDFRRALAELQARLRQAGTGGRYLAPDSLHLTLAFVGECAEDLTPLLPPVEAPFPLVLSGVGFFPRARVLWAGVEPSAQLDQLAALVRKNLDGAGLHYDPQAFNPHFTLIRKPVLPGGGALPEVAVPSASMTVSEVCLYRSDHGEDGMKYTVIGRSGGRV